MVLYCIIVSMLLILLSSTQATYSAEGRPVVAKKKEGGGDGVLVVSSMIGSRPPRCERRCIPCGHCEAIQVPVAPPQTKHFSSTINSRGDDKYSNYKPMNWKCKCGNRILDP